MKKSILLSVGVIGVIAIFLFFAGVLNLNKTKKNDKGFVPAGDNFYNVLKFDFDKTYFSDLQKLTLFYKRIYHLPIYSIIYKNNKVLALYDGNETNQTVLLNRFRQIFIPESLFLKPFRRVYQDTKQETKKINLKNFINKYKNKKINFIEAVYIYENLNKFLDKDAYNDVYSYLFPITKKQIIFGKKSQIIIEDDFFYDSYHYIKGDLFVKNKKNFSITPILLKEKPDASKEDFNNAVLSIVDIYNCFPELTTNNPEFDNEFKINILTSIPYNKLYLSGYGVSLFNNKLLSLDFFYDVLGCSMKYNDCYYFKTFNIDLRNFKYLNLSDFFSENYIYNYILNVLYNKIVEKYNIKIPKNKLYKIIADSFTIDAEFLYFYFDQKKISDNYFVIKIPYNKERLKFKF